MTIDPVETRLAAAEHYRAAVAEIPEVLELAAEACRAPMAALKMIGGGTAHFAGTIGIRTVVGVPQSNSVCDVVAAVNDTMVVGDASRDPRLAAHPLVKGAEHVRFLGAAPLRHGDRVVGALCVFDDQPRRHNPEATVRMLSRIARRVDAETGLRHLAATQAFPAAVGQDEVVTAISHEIRTPLATISGNLELLTEMGAIAPGFERRVDAITRNADRLCRTVDNLLRTVNQQMHEPIGDRRRFDLGILTSAAVTALRSGRVRVIRPDIPVWVTADPKLIEVALGHLLGNALCFGEGKPVEVTVTAHPRPAVVVRDHGSGLDEAELTALGVPFLRGREARLAQLPGLGLGLAVSRRIVEAQGGTLRLERAPGTGLIARISLSG
ncbi:ATP-binding protein [Actinoplanes sp. NPDC020271]|uniref:GAF domain-containing sensor histidine kinase n=1 Tax=Actinoplanes sp. NPDC020271 TaxID=3363896 RepID=UPI0037AD6993